MGDGKPLLEIVGLHAGIDGNEILKGIDLEIGAGEIHAIMGRNGSGKGQGREYSFLSSIHRPFRDYRSETS